MSQFVEQILATSGLEWGAVVLAIAYVLLAAKQSNWCWAAAFVSTAIYTYLFWQVTLPFQSLLNFFYMVMAGYGYYQWRKGAEEPVVVRTLPVPIHLGLVPALLLLAYGLAHLASTQFNSQHLWLDASLQVFSMVTTFMVAHKVLENWLYWIVINALSAWLYAQSGLVLSACLFGAYVIFAVYGYRQWRSDWQQQDAR